MPAALKDRTEIADTHQWLAANPVIHIHVTPTSP